MLLPVPPIVVVVIVIAVAIVAVVPGIRTGADLQRLLQPEREHGFGWDMENGPASDGLSAGPGSTAGESADGRALSSAGNRADDGAEQRAAAHVFSGSPVRAHASAPGGVIGVGGNHVAPALNRD